VSARRGFAIACAASLAATLGDFAMLLVSTAGHFARSVEAPEALVWLGGALGVICLPLHTLGYAAAARSVFAGAPIAARVTRIAGIAASLLGAVIHGLTALAIQAQLEAGPGAAPAMAPLDAVALSPELVALWSAAGLCALAACGAITLCAARGHNKWALATPLALSLALAALGSATELGKWLLLPAAPNLAHLGFFALGWSRTRGS